MVQQRCRCRIAPLLYHVHIRERKKYIFGAKKVPVRRTGAYRHTKNCLWVYECAAPYDSCMSGIVQTFSKRMIRPYKCRKCRPIWLPLESVTQLRPNNVLAYDRNRLLAIVISMPLYTELESLS